MAACSGGLTGVDDAAQKPVEFTREMGITHRAFFHTLKGAVEGRTYSIVDGEGTRPSSATIADGANEIRILMQPQWVRRIATIKMPVTDVTFVFDGHTLEEAEQVMGRFEIFFRRGGG